MVALLVSASPAAALPAACSPSGSMVTCTYGSTGAEQSFVVPVGVASLQVVVTGGSGGSSGVATGTGGRGAQVSGSLAVFGGEMLYLEVGGNGGSTFASSGAAGGFNGGGVGGTGSNGQTVQGVGGSGGGGASDIRTSPASQNGSLDTRLVVAAGGGGAPGSYSQTANGGDAGQPGTGFYNRAVGGSAGTATAGGAGGNQGQLGGGSAGALGSGGAGGSAPAGVGEAGGGGGGGGLYGGGGGSEEGAGGGGGSSLVPAGFSMGLDSTGTAQIVLSYTAPVVVARVSRSMLSFPTQAQSTLSAPQAVTVTNAGLSQLVVTGLTFTGPDPHDYLVTYNGCLGEIAPTASCMIGVSFAPQEQGSSSAILQIASNDPNSPASVALSGIGGQLPQGAPGQTGATGKTGPRGPTGQQGPAGKIELVKCTTVTTGTGKHKHKTRKCIARLVSGPVKFTTTGSIHASLTRGHVIYATGEAIPTGNGWRLVLTHQVRQLRYGRYTLTLRTVHGQRRVAQRTTITIA